jgi:methyl-accepting chemotaxis protein-like sensor
MKHVPSSSVLSVGNEVTLFAQRRSAIDLIATSRARAIRSALFGGYLFRPNPIHPEDEGTRSNFRKILREQAAALTRSSELALGRDPKGEIPEEVCAWIGRHGARMPTHAAALATMRDLTNNVVDAAEADCPDQLEKALNDHLLFGRGGYFETVTEFCDALWNDLDNRRHTEVETAIATGDAIIKTLKRLEHIGKHVRLVSLNASVEAARVGDAGRGLGVIAVEFKTLAEEIQMLATTARDDIAGMTLRDTTASRKPHEPAV